MFIITSYVCSALKALNSSPNKDNDVSQMPNPMNLGRHINIYPSRLLATLNVYDYGLHFEILFI